METLYMFDVDGTLCLSNTSDALHPTAVLWLQKHKPQMVALCSNQGGVGLRYWMKPREGYEGFGHDTWPKLPTEEDVGKRLRGLAEQIEDITGGYVKWYAAFAYQSGKGNWSPTPTGKEDSPAWSRAWRKPAAGMLLQAMTDYWATAEECIFVGDQESDQQAAAAAGVAFANANTFFAVPVTLLYPSGWIADWLPPFRRAGLDLTATKRRLEGMLKKEAAAYWRVGEVTIRQLADYWGDEFELSPEAATVIPGESLANTISDLFINREWLVYESAEAHADALQGTRFLSAVTLMDVYGIDSTEAWSLYHGER